MEVNKNLELAHLFYAASFQCGKEGSQVFNTKSVFSFMFSSRHRSVVFNFSNCGYSNKINYLDL